jgi:S1-C subfamily serine protease
MLLLALGAKANELERILDQANKYTVKISNSTNTPFIEDSYNASFGSGILIDKTNGIIITNAHVSSYSPSINRVNFKYSDPIQSKQIYIDPEIDLAFLQVDPKSIPKEAIEAKLQCKNDYKQGQNVVAFGHPNGKDFTITRGIISAIRYETDFFESIQTDAAINPGNSGGPLVDSTGAVIGVNSAIASLGMDLQTGSIGLGFAIPINQARKTADQLIKNGVATYPVIGISLDMKYTGEGALVATSNRGILPGSPAEKAGLRSGDIVIAFDGKPITGPEELIVSVRSKNVGDVVTLTYKRNGAERTVSLTLIAAKK